MTNKPFIQALPALVLVMLLILACSPSNRASSPFLLPCHCSVPNQKISFGEQKPIGFHNSPFDRDKVFVSFHNDISLEWFEYELGSGLGRKLGRDEKWKAQYSNPRAPKYNDVHGSTLWVGSLPHSGGQQLLRYDQKSETAEFLPLKSVQSIYRKHNNLYFETPEGIYRWDSLTNQALSIDSISDELSANKASENYWVWQQEQHSSEDHSIFEGYERLQKFSSAPLYRQEKSIFLRREDTWEATPFKLGKEKIVEKSPFVWQVQARKIVRYSLPTQEFDTLSIVIPRTSHKPFRYVFDGDQVWMIREKQVLIANFETRQLHSRPQPIDLVQFTLDNCHVYYLSGNSLIVETKMSFMRNLPVLNPEEYLKEVNGFKQDLDSMGLNKLRYSSFSKPALLDSNLRKWNILNSKYSNTNNFEINRSLVLARIGIYRQHFSDLLVYPPKISTKCYRDTLLAGGARISCWSSLNRKAWQNQNVDSIRFLHQEYLKFLPSKGMVYEALLKDTDILDRYLFKIDSIKSLPLSPDSSAYYQTMAFALYTNASCLPANCGGAQGWQLSLRLKSFIQQYPESKLADNAAYHMNFYEIGMLGMTYMDQGSIDLEREGAWDGIKGFAQQYPDSELRHTQSLDSLQFSMGLRFEMDTISAQKLLTHIAAVDSSTELADRAKNLLESLSGQANP